MINYHYPLHFSFKLFGRLQKNIYFCTRNKKKQTDHELQSEYILVALLTTHKS